METQFAVALYAPVHCRQFTSHGGRINVHDDKVNEMDCPSSKFVSLKQTNPWHPEVIPQNPKVIPGSDNKKQFQAICPLFLGTPGQIMGVVQVVAREKNGKLLALADSRKGGIAAGFWMEWTSTQRLCELRNKLTRGIAHSLHYIRDVSSWFCISSIISFLSCSPRSSLPLHRKMRKPGNDDQARMQPHDREGRNKGFVPLG